MKEGNPTYSLGVQESFPEVKTEFNQTYPKRRKGGRLGTTTVQRHTETKTGPLSSVQSPEE